MAKALKVGIIGCGGIANSKHLLHHHGDVGNPASFSMAEWGELYLYDGTFSRALG